MAIQDSGLSIAKSRVKYKWTMHGFAPSMDKFMKGLPVLGKLKADDEFTSTNVKPTKITMSTPDVDSVKRQKQTDPIIISDAVCTGYDNTTNPRQ